MSGNAGAIDHENRAPVVEGLLDTCSDDGRLIGTRCMTCATLYYPRSRGCRNPDCDSSAVREEVLPEHGTLLSYTVQHYQPPPLYRVDDWCPYAIGLLDFGDGLHVMGKLAAIPAGLSVIGCRYRVGAERLYVDEQGVERWAPVFRSDHAGAAM